MIGKGCFDSQIVDDIDKNADAKAHFRYLYITLARAVESGNPLVIGLTVGQVVERLKTLSE